MNKQAPSTSRIIAMVAFAASCVGLLLFLWISFGGSIPLAAQGYRLSAEFDQAIQLSPQSDVRISGVSVGKVISTSLDRKTGLTKAVIEINSQYAPRPSDTRAILRAKSLLGEAFITLSPGSADAPKLPDGGMLPHTQIAPTVQLDQILSTFDPATRHAFMVWQRGDALALTGRGEAFNAAFAQLFPFATNVDRVLAALHRDSAATRTLLHDGGQVFSALSASPSELQGLIRNSNAVFAATAARNRELAATIRVLPAYLVSTRATVTRVNQFATIANPLVDELRPAAVQLSPALEASVALAPKLLEVMQELGPLTAASKAGIPAFENFLNASVPWLKRLTPFLGNLVPVFNYLNTYRGELAAFFANSTATSQAIALNLTSNKVLHYLRISNPVNPEVVTSYQHRLESNRANPYMTPGGYKQLLNGLSVFGRYLCTNTPQPSIGPTIPANLQQILRSTYYTVTPGGPPCKAQGLLGPLTSGQQQAFPHLQPLP